MLVVSLVRPDCFGLEGLVGVSCRLPPHGSGGFTRWVCHIGADLGITSSAATLSLVVPPFVFQFVQQALFIQFNTARFTGFLETITK